MLSSYEDDDDDNVNRDDDDDVVRCLDMGGGWSVKAVVVIIVCEASSGSGTAMDRSLMMELVSKVVTMVTNECMNVMCCVVFG